MMLLSASRPPFLLRSSQGLGFAQVPSLLAPLCPVAPRARVVLSAAAGHDASAAASSSGRGAASSSSQALKPETRFFEPAPAAQPVNGPWWTQLLKNASKAVALGLVAMALVLASPGNASAASSGGRAGGRSFSSSSSHSGGASRSSSSSSSGGGSRGSSSYGSSGFSSSRFGPSRMAPSMSGTVIISPGYSPGYYGSYNSMLGMDSRPAVVAGSMAANGLSDGLVLVLLLAVAANFIASAARDLRKDSMEEVYGSQSSARADIAVVCLQVGVLAVAELQPQLAALADGADTASPLGLQALLQDVCLALLRRPEYVTHATMQAQAGLGVAGAESLLDQHSLEQRSKFKEETRSNFGGRKRARALSGGDGSSGSSRGPGGPQELMVVTLLVAAQHGSQLLSTASAQPGRRGGLPGKLSSAQDVQRALKALASIPPTDIQAVELLWTPEAPGDSLSRDELVADFPTLVTLV